MKLLMLTAFCLFTASSCYEKGTKVTGTGSNRTSKHISYTDTKGKQYKFLAQIPDSLRTPKQKLFAKSLNDVILNGVVAENNHMVLKMSKAECLDKGMTESDYYKLQTSIQENNHFFDSTGNKKVATLVDDLHRFIKGDPSAKGVSMP
jgi:hypothetical protein